MTAVGDFALWVALPFGLWGAVLSFMGGRYGRGAWVLSAERSIHAVLALTLVASVGMVTAFLTDDFRYLQVYEHSNVTLDLRFKVAGLWAGVRGSLLLWVLGVSVFATLALRSGRGEGRRFRGYRAGMLLSVLSSLLLLTLCFAPPFETSGFDPSDGLGLAPALQSEWAALRGFALTLGFAGFAIPFAYGAAALLSARPDAGWVREARGWVLGSWFLVSIGLLSGMRWVYAVLGGTGPWPWDPIDNLSLLPWLAATVFLHANLVLERTGRPRASSAGLLLGTFLLTLLVPFLTRSGLVASVHPSEPARELALALLVLLTCAAVLSVVLLLRWSTPSEARRTVESLLSREVALFMGCAIGMAALFVVAWGTFLPVLTEVITGVRTGVGAPYFERWVVPLALVLLALLGMVPGLSWRRTDGRRFLRNLAIPAFVGVATGGVLAGVGVRRAFPLLTLAVLTFVLAGIFRERWRGVRAASRPDGVGAIPASAGGARRWGAALVHLGVVVSCIGLAGIGLGVEVRQSMEPGDSVSIPSAFGPAYTLHYVGISSGSGPNLWQVITTFQLERNGSRVGFLDAEYRYHQRPSQSMALPGLRSSPMEDLRLEVMALDEQVGLGNDPRFQRASFRFRVHPLASWIWYGGFLLLLGACIAFWPRPAGRRGRSVPVGESDSRRARDLGGGA